DQGADGPYLYLAMEYVPGRTLKELLRDSGRFPPAAALEIMAGVLDGLAAAHASGIVHRDVKPENVLLTADGRIKVADFGLARAQWAAGHTRAGLLVGTVAYVPPEQVTGGTTGPRGDVYSAGGMGAGVQGLGEAPWLDLDASAATDGRWTRQFNGGGHEDSHTLIVDREDGGGRHHIGREPFLGRWLFGPRLLIVVLIVALGLG